MKLRHWVSLATLATDEQLAQYPYLRKIRGVGVPLWLFATLPSDKRLLFIGFLRSFQKYKKFRDQVL